MEEGDGEIGEILRELCRQKDVELLEGNAMPDHIHMLLSIPPRVQRGDDDGVSEGQECHSDSSGVAENARNFVWTSVLVTRLLCEYRGPG